VIQCWSDATLQQTTSDGQKYTTLSVFADVTRFDKRPHADDQLKHPPTGTTQHMREINILKGKRVTRARVVTENI
jgi:hypothetical protein